METLAELCRTPASWLGEGDNTVKSRLVVFLVVCCVVLSVAAVSAETVKLKLATMGSQGWSATVLQDSQPRGGVYEKDSGYYGMPTPSFQFINGNKDRTSRCWGAISTASFDGKKVSQITALNITIVGIEGDQAGVWLPPHFVLALKQSSSGVVNRFVEWIPWSDGTARAEQTVKTYNAMTDGSWHCPSTGNTWSTTAAMLASFPDLTFATAAEIESMLSGFAGKSFNLGYADWTSATHVYSDSSRGTVGSFDVGIDGVTTTYLLNQAEPAGPLGGPLRVLSSNPRYVTNDTGEAIYLTGSHVWNNFQDWGTTDPPPALGHTAFLDFVQSHNHNFIRGWAWEQTRWAPWTTSSDLYIANNRYQRTGPGAALDGKPKFDVTKFDQTHFDRLRARVIEAGNRGIYYGVMLFQGFSIDDKRKDGNPWPGHPFNASNNINGINGDPEGDGEGQEVHTLAVPAITTLQENFVKKVIGTLNDLDNVIWEITNESNSDWTAWDSTPWQYHMIDLIHNYEAGKPKQHLVWMSAEGTKGDYSYLYGSNAEVISPLGLVFRDNPPAADGRRIMILDTDHLWGIGGNRSWVWRSFTRGYNPIFMDPIYGVPQWPLTLDPYNPDYVATRSAMGHTRAYAEKMDLKAMTPQNSLSSTKFCLAKTPVEYLIYQPGSGAFTVNLTGTSAEFLVEWFNPATGVATSGGAVAGGATRTLTPPFSGDAVVYLKATASPPPTVTAITPSSGFNTGTTIITDLAGTGFLSGAAVKLQKSGQSDIIAASVYVASSTKITCTLDLNGRATGLSDLLVTNPDLQSGSLANGFGITISDSKSAVGTTSRSLMDRIATTGSLDYRFRVWGVVETIDSSTFWLDDGSGTPIKVFAPGHAVSTNSYASAIGTADISSIPPVLVSSSDRVQRY